MKSMIRMLGVCAAIGAGSMAAAQEGHPLKGSWIGVWEGNDVHDEFVLMVLDYDGDKVTGIINPGTDNIEIDNVELNPENWAVHIEADTEKDGQEVSYVIDGTIENLELASRSIVGTWKAGDDSGKFEISRQ